MSLVLPSLGMGTWGMGGKYEKDESNVEESITALRYGFDHGIRLVDVAELYGKGLAETIVGRALEGYTRSDMVITSKVWKENLGYDDVLRAAEGSLKRLKTSFIDLYLIHWPNPSIPLLETMRALKRLHEEGIIKHIGVSNFSVDDMNAAQEHLGNMQLHTNQFEYSLVNRNAEDMIIPYCREHHIQIMAYRPFAKGMLLNQSNPQIQCLVEKYKKSVPQLALNWVIHKRMTVIPKASKIAHIEENIGALGWDMADEDYSLLADSFMLQ